MQRHCGGLGYCQVYAVVKRCAFNYRQHILLVALETASKQ